MTLGDFLIERIDSASLAELARAQFLVASDEAVEDGDAARVAAALTSAVAKKNQFAASEPALASGVAHEVNALFDSIAKGESRAEVFPRHAIAISKMFRGILGDAPREVVSATYSPELQLAVLGLSASAMREPILDIGCGDGALVRHLRAQRKDARGLDREAPLDIGERGDWLTHEYGVARFGTIVSHLGFSLHFMHQEMKRSELAFEYARTYMRVLRALAPGGTFAYVPGLPFIEAMLRAPEHRVVRVALAPELVTENVARVQEATGLVLDTATHVTRRE